MRLSFPALFFLSLVLLAPSGCTKVREEREQIRLEAATSGYRQAIRWGYYDAAVQFVEPQQRANQLTPALENIRVTGYEVILPPVISEAETAEQVARIEYVLNDRQRLKTLTDRQRWHYDEASSRWYLVSGLPRFAAPQDQ